MPSFEVLSLASSEPASHRAIISTKPSRRAASTWAGPMKPVPMMPALMVGAAMGINELADRLNFGPAFGLLRGDNGFEDCDAFCAVEKVGVDFGVGGNSVDEIKDGMDEGMFVADDMAGGPPGGEIGMAVVRAEDGFESGFVRWVAAIGVFEFIHAL